ncbi:MAG: cobalamin B12-binding domain protein [Dehalococcoidia bacterium]|nr:cobalamin B12-binding domain protein [Dehalococcoidia bacterium]
MAQSSNNRIRVLLAKPGLDIHDRGARIITRSLRDAGIEVIYIGVSPHPRTPEQIVASAIQEDVDVLGLSFHSPTYMEIVTRIMELLKENGRRDLPVVIGGVIPPNDVAALKGLGVAGVFGPGSPMEEIVEFIRGCGLRSRV